ncbi:MAG: DUF3990 domain-containing protein [Lachnospiraceae bacterium]|nr:DUF3990 domain-containing protein [Lachnospiraceae bacterium]
MQDISLFHAGYQVIKRPDLKIGRKNADFGQGFYLSDKEAFSKRWARERKGEQVYINKYLLATKDLKIKRFSRDREWFEYIVANRAAREDLYADYDVIIGPIANDTIYNTWGIITSGMIPKEIALELLLLGPAYEQTVIKTEKAADALTFLGADMMAHEEIASYQETVAQEEEAFQELFAKRLEELMEE